MTFTRSAAAALDAVSPLLSAGTRERFEIPDGLNYLDGNSLGLLPRAVPGRIREVVEQEWGQGLIRS